MPVSMSQKGTGHRASMYLDAIAGAHRDDAELVGLVEPNPGRLAAHRVERRDGGGHGVGGPGADQHPGPVVDEGPGGREPQPPARAGEQESTTTQAQVHQAAEPRRERRTYCMIPPLR